jgi:serine/threonine-protein kinase
VDRNGKEEPLGTPPNDYAYPKISPDGSRVALTVSSGPNEADIWIWDFIRKSLTRLTFDKSSNVPIWTPDSKKIAFQNFRAGQIGTYWKAADGTGKDEKLCFEPDRSIFPWSFSSDGKNLVVSVIEGPVAIENDKWSIGMLSMEGDHARKPLLQEKHALVMPQVSPDGHWIAYGSDESTGVALKTEVYIRPFPEVDKGKWQASTNGGSCPRWSPNGRELFYLSSDNSLMEISVQTDPTFRLGTPKRLFQSIYAGLSATSGIPYDISPDGKRFLMMKEPQTTPSESAGPRKINIVVNWFEELKQRVPTK